MPMHDWSRVDAEFYHGFHKNWMIEIYRILNRQLLSAQCTVLLEHIDSTSKLNRIKIIRGLDKPLAVIEIVSPGNKDTRHAVQSFRTKSVEYLQHGVNLLIIDPFAPSTRDPGGLHQMVWDDFCGASFPERPADEPFSVASFDAVDGPTGYLDPFAVGDLLPDAPLFLAPGRYVNLPLEATYQSAWAEIPALMRRMVE